jgi:anti-sigma regulatory factor (Ser/Thr protein kinase)/serine/threonine protein phosphatase PrpC
VDSVLIDGWLAGVPAVPTVDEASVSAARAAVRACGAAAGLDAALVESVAAAAGELAQNQLRHARLGKVAVRQVKRGGVPGIEIIAADRGHGIADPALAIEGRGPTPTSLGAGLAGARRIMHELDVDVRIGEGTCIRARAFAEPLPRRREIGILGRALTREPVSGDHAGFVREDDVLLFAVADGIGHGALAHDAAGRAIATFREHPTASPSAILDACDRALVGTRGAVMAVARIDERTHVLEQAGVGNVTTRVERWRSSRILTGSTATLGARGTRRRPLAEAVQLDPREVVLMYTDGLTTRVDLSGEAELLQAHPIVIAQRVMAGFARPNDDALVLVSR